VRHNFLGIPFYTKVIYNPREPLPHPFDVFPARRHPHQAPEGTAHTSRAADVATMNALYAGAFGPPPYPARAQPHCIADFGLIPATVW
jgi:hypothetical protein